MHENVRLLILDLTELIRKTKVDFFVAGENFEEIEEFADVYAPLLGTHPLKNRLN